MKLTYHRIRRAGGALFLTAACLAAAAPVRADELTLASRADGRFGLKSDGWSPLAALAADGSRVAFASSATNLDPADADGLHDIYVRDLGTHDTHLVSRAAGEHGAKADGSSYFPSISADGRYVAFASDAPNLHPGDSDRATDVFVRDLLTGSVILVSRASGSAGVKGTGGTPAISADGRHVAFVSAARLDPADTNDVGDVYVRDLVAATTTLVSRASGDGPAGDRSSAWPAVSGDGGVVAFESIARNLVPGDDTGFAPDVFARDLSTGETILVSRAAGSGSKVPGGDASISGDGRHVTFTSFSALVHPDDRDSSADVFMRDLEAQTTELVSRSNGLPGADANAHAFEGEISATGRFLAFRSVASNLHPDDRDTIDDVYVRDLQDGTTTLASRGSDPLRRKGNDLSYSPGVSADGLLAAFVSEASNLHLEDGDRWPDVYARQIGDARDCDLARISARVGSAEFLRACL